VIIRYNAGCKLIPYLQTTCSRCDDIMSGMSVMVCSIAYAKSKCVITSVGSLLNAVARVARLTGNGGNTSRSPAPCVTSIHRHNVSDTRSQWSIDSLCHWHCVYVLHLKCVHCDHFWQCLPFMTAVWMGEHTNIPTELNWTHYYYYYYKNRRLKWNCHIKDVARTLNIIIFNRKRVHNTQWMLLLC